MDISTQAPDYSGGLFAPMTQGGDQGMGCGMDLDDVLRARWDRWRRAISIKADVVLAAAQGFPKNNTTGRYRLTTEQWATAMQTRPELSAVVAWAMEQEDDEVQLRDGARSEGHLHGGLRRHGWGGGAAENNNCGRSGRVCRRIWAMEPALWWLGSTVMFAPQENNTYTCELCRMNMRTCERSGTSDSKPAQREVLAVTLLPKATSPHLFSKAFTPLRPII